MKKILFILLSTNFIFAQTPSFPEVNIDVATQPLECDNNCTDLTAVFPQTGVSTTYTVQSIPFAPPFPFTGGTPVSVNQDDVYSPIVTLPFDFCFFDALYTSGVIGSNGVISFNTALANTTNAQFNFSNPIPTTTIPNIHIMGPFQDLDPRQTSPPANPSVNFSVLGTAPARTWVVNFSRIGMYDVLTGSCNINGWIQTSQIVLYETTNIIEFHIFNRSSNCTVLNSANAILGIQNPAMTQAFAPAGRNFGAWSATQESWRFVPDGVPNWTFNWLDDSGNVVSTNPTINVCVSQATTYTAEVTYTNCNGNQVIVSDSVTLDIENEPVVDLGPDIDECIPVGGNINLNADINEPTATYEWFESGNLIPGETNPSLTVTNTGVYSVAVTFGVCVLQDTVNVNLFSVNLGNVSDVELCDDSDGSADGFVDFDLSTKDLEASNGVAGLTVTYHTSQADADTGANPIPTIYTNTTNPETIFVRVEDLAATTVCFATTSFELRVFPAEASSVTDFIVCDDPSNDGIEIFDLNIKGLEAIGSQNPADIGFTFHNSQTDADNGLNALPILYQNVSNPETVYIRIENLLNADCFVTTSFDLIIDTQPIVNNISAMVVCDDPTNDGIEAFDLSLKDTEVLGAQNPTDFNISYHNTQADADTGANALTSPYNNTTSPEVIYVRIENANNADCFDTGFFQISVDAQPTANAVGDIALCDDLSEDGSEVFDLNTQTTDILGGQNPANFTVTYHTSQADADTGANALPGNYSNTSNPESIFVRIENVLNADCFDTTSFQISVLPIPQTVAVTPLEVCDNDGDGFSDFNLNDKLNEILNGQTGMQVTYYASAADATVPQNPIGPNFTNTTPNNQTIFVRIEDQNNGCFNLTNFDVIALPPPAANMPSPLELCDDDDDGILSFNLSLLDAEIGGGQPGINITYHGNQNDADAGLNALPNTFSNSTNPQQIVARVTNAAGCFATTTASLVVLPRPQPSLPGPYLLCIDNDGSLVEGPAILDTGLNNVDFSFEWTFNGAPISGGAVLQATEAGTYSVTATDVVTGCQNQATAVVEQTGIPASFSVEVVTPPFIARGHTIVATATSNSPQDNFWFSLDDGPFQDSGVFENVSPGVHTVTIANRRGCGEIVREVVVLGYPLYFTPNADGFHDTWNITDSNLFPDGELFIFDRFGKLIKQIRADGEGWDGTFNGNPLPSSDYWFTFTFNYEGIERRVKGHFSLKR
ncbi:MAG: T9SS type B sorting domain-containing protein [Flavobacteriaceae bacterium]|nr:T9SS type B sorting domain-containing protein [Flavobacteriaceae bacterium]